MKTAQEIRDIATAIFEDRFGTKPVGQTHNIILNGIEIGIEECENKFTPELREKFFKECTDKVHEVHFFKKLPGEVWEWVEKNVK